MKNHAQHNYFRFDDIRILLNSIFAQLISVQLLKFGKRSSAYTEMFCHRIQRGTGYIYSDKIICIYCTCRFFVIQMSIWNILCNTTNVPVTIALNSSNCQWWKTVQSWIKKISLTDKAVLLHHRSITLPEPGIWSFVMVYVSPIIFIAYRLLPLICQGNSLADWFHSIDYKLYNTSIRQLIFTNKLTDVT